MFDDLKKLKTSCGVADAKVAKAEELRVVAYSELHKKQDEAKELLGVHTARIPNLNFNIPKLSFRSSDFKKYLAMSVGAIFLSWFIPPAIALVATVAVGLGIMFLNNQKP